MKFRRYLRSQALPIALCLGVVVLSIAVLAAHLPLLYKFQQRIESLAFDARMRLTLPDQAEPDPAVVIVAVDERSLAAEGHWPWPRSRIARLVDGISAQGASVVAFDSVFAEAERNPAAQLVEQAGAAMDSQLRNSVQSWTEAVDQDRIFSASLAANQVVLGYTFSDDKGTAQGTLPTSSVVYQGDLDNTSFMNLPAYVGNISVLQAHATTGGFFTVTPDYDGVIRRVPAVARYGDKLYASLAVEAVRLTLGAEHVEVFTKAVGDQQRIDHVSIGGMIDLPTDDKGQLIAPFRGASPAFSYVSATDVLHDKVTPGVMEGSVVLIGITAAGLHDLRATPVQAVYPGVEVHATLISAMLGEGFPVMPSWALGADVAVILILGLAATLGFPALAPSRMILIAFLMMAAIAGFNLWLWVDQKIVLSLATPLLAIATITFIHVDFGFLSESRSRRKLRDSFGQYVPPSLVEQMYADPDKDFGLQGESRELSVLFSDIRGFTTISEALPPQELKQFLNEYFTPITEIIFRHNGTIDKYVGDMVMAFWGAPVRDNAHRQHAIAAALEMLETLPRLQQEFVARGWPQVDVGIGINTGSMSVGDMGSSFRRSYTVIGDSVNLGSRLEGLTKHYGVRFIVSEFAVAGVENILLRKLDRVRVKGKSEPVTIFEVCCEMQKASAGLQAEIAAHDSALAHYFAGAWSAAHTAFTALAEQFPERYCYRLYLERIGSLRDKFASGGWDGVYDHSSK